LAKILTIGTISLCCFAEDGEKSTKNQNAHAEPLFCSLIMVIELSGVHVLFQAKIEQPEVQLPLYYIHFEITQFNWINTSTTRLWSVPLFSKSILKSLVIPAIWLALSGAIYSQIALFFALNRIFFSANENKTVKQNNQSHNAITSRWHDADIFKMRCKWN